MWLLEDHDLAASCPHNGMFGLGSSLQKWESYTRPLVAQPVSASALACKCGPGRRCKRSTLCKHENHVDGSVITKRLQISVGQGLEKKKEKTPRIAVDKGSTAFIKTESNKCAFGLEICICGGKKALIFIKQRPHYPRSKHGFRRLQLYAFR